MPLRVLITGGSSGIGRACALRLAAEGHAIALVARGEARLRDAESEIRSLPGVEPPLILPADVRETAEIEAAVARATERFGGLDALVHSAGGARFLPLEQTTDAVWREVVGANLEGLFRTVRAVTPRLRASGGGRIIGVLSIASRRGFPNATAYSAAKAGALGFLDSLREELRPDRIQVTALLAGATATPLWDGIGGEWDRARMMLPEQVAEVVVCALREETSGTWEEIRVGPPGGVL